MKIAIAGYGVEGKANYNYFRQQGDVTIVDEREEIEDLPENVNTILGKDSFSKLKEFDLVIRTAGLSPKKINTEGKIWSTTNEFFAKCPAPIIGVTGTKGKGTTCSLIAAILRSAGIKVHLVGNIGTAAISILSEISKKDIVVFEISSFQLWDIKASPQVAVVLMIEPDHLDIHDGFDDYLGAKSNIGKYQGINDIFIYHPTNKNSAVIAGMSNAGSKYRYMTDDAAHINDNMIIINDKNICSIKEVGLIGDYNLQNICAAISASWQYTQDTKAIAKAVREFKGLEHRLELFATINGIRFYDDSFSSAPVATVAAITAFSEPLIVIVGGFDRGLDLEFMVSGIVNSNNIKKVILIGEIRNRLAKELETADYHNFDIFDYKNMKDIVEHLLPYTKPGDVVLLSPGCASFDMFENFISRGKKFKKAVNDLDG